MASETKEGRKIQFGIFDWVEWDQNSPSQILEDRLKLLEYADKQDFSATTRRSTTPRPSVSLHPPAYSFRPSPSAPPGSVLVPWSSCCPSTIPCA